MRIEPVDGWKEAAKVTRRMGALILVAVVAGLVFPTPWSAKPVVPGTADKTAPPTHSGGNAAVKTDPATGKADKEGTAGRAGSDAGGTGKAVASVSDAATAADEPARKPIAHSEPQVRKISKSEGEQKAPEPPASARGSWSSVLSAD